MRHAVVVQKIFLQRHDEFFGTSGFQSHAVVHAGVVDQRVQPPGDSESFSHCPLAFLGARKFSGHGVAAQARCFQFLLGLPDSIDVAGHDDGDGPFFRYRTGDAPADAFVAAGDEHYFVCEP